VVSEPFNEGVDMSAERFDNTDDTVIDADGFEVTATTAAQATRPVDDFDGKGRPVLITAAAQSYDEQHRARVRKYMTLMAFRIPALLLAALAYGTWHNGMISLAIVAGSIPLPWMAVLIANDRPPRQSDEPRRFDAVEHLTAIAPTAERPALERPRGDEQPLWATEA